MMARDGRTVKRPYDASARQEQARARRLAVVLAARDLFESNGFRLTTIAAIAARAEVSAETVYKTFGNKGAIAKAVFDLEIAGDDDPVPIAERPSALALEKEPDARRKVAMFVDGMTQRQQRSAKVHILIRDGRHVHDALEAVWSELNEEALTAATMLARLLIATGQLRPDLTLNGVRDVLWNYLAIDHYERLVLYRGWSLERYRTWLTGTIADAICA